MCNVIFYAFEVIRGHGKGMAACELLIVLLCLLL